MSAMDHAYVEEHGLVEAYLADRLSESERDAFEAHYFACDKCMEQLELASDFEEGMLQVAAEDAARARTGLLAGLALLSRRSRFLLGGALLLLLALPLGLLIARNRGLERQLAEAQAGTGERIADLEARLRSLEQNATGERRRLEEELAKERQARAAAEKGAAVRPQVNVPVFTLAAVRSGEEGREPVNRVPLPSAAESIVFDLELAAIDSPDYRALLTARGGEVIWQSRGLRPNDRDALVLLLPASLLPPGVYELTIEGAKSDGTWFPAAAYPFRVVRQP